MHGSRQDPHSWPWKSLPFKSRIASSASCSCQLPFSAQAPCKTDTGRLELDEPESGEDPDVGDGAIRLEVLRRVSV